MLMERERDCLLKSLRFLPQTPWVKSRYTVGKTFLTAVDRCFAAPISFATLETANLILCPNQ
jgi:hypothetical protein